MNLRNHVEAFLAELPPPPRQWSLIALCRRATIIVLLMFFSTKTFADNVQFGFLTALENRAGYTPWTWTISDGASFSGYYAWSCGDIIAGSALYSQVYTNLQIKPETPYTCTVSAADYLCQVAAAIWPDGCYDLYISDPLAANGFVKSGGYPNWEGGYVYGYTVSSNPNDPRYNTMQATFTFCIRYNTNTIPASSWNVKDETGWASCLKPEKGVYPISDDGISTALGTAINTNYMGTNYPCTFQLFDTNSIPTGCYLRNYTNTYTTNGMVITTNYFWLTNQVVLVAGTNPGMVEVDAITLNPNPCLNTNTWFDVGGCQKCKAGDGTCQAMAQNRSVDLQFSLGPSMAGGNDAFLQVESEVPSTNLGSPQSLQYNFIRPDVQIITNSAGWLRQVHSLDRVVDIITNSSASYMVNFYHVGDVMGIDTNGLYYFTNSPFEEFLVELVNNDTNHVELIDSGAPYPTDYYWVTNGWSMVTGNGLRNETLLTTTSGSTYTKLRTIQNAQGHIDHQSTEAWQIFPYGARLMATTNGSGPLAQIETFTYTADGMLQQANHSDGSWDIYTYDSMDRQVGHYSPFLNSAPTTNSVLCRYTASTYNDSVVSGSGDVASVNPYEPRMVVNYVLGQEVGRRYSVVMPGEEIDFECAVAGAAWNNSSNLVTTTYSFQDAVNFGEPSKIVKPDGTIQVFSYDTGVASPFPGQTAPYDKTTIWTGQPDSGYSYVVDGTMDETWTDSLQRKKMHRVTDVVSQVVIEQEKYYYDSVGHLTNTVYLNRSSSAQSYDCCSLESSTAPDGTVTSYGYDAAKRQIMTIQNGITVSNILNANGDVLGTVRYGTDGSAITNSLATYTDGGEMVSSTEGLGNATSYTNYFDGSGQLIKMTTYPNLSTRIETYAMDGSLLKVTGTAVLPVRYAYGVGLDGGVQRLYKQEIKLDGSGNDTTEWTQTYTDMLGRDYKTLYSSVSGTPASQSFYNNNGQLVEQVDPDGVTTLYQYNLKGEVAYTAVDMNTNGIIDFTGMDRITSTASDVISNGYNLYLNRTRTYVWKTANANVSNLVSTAETSVDGLQSWNITYNSGVGITNYSQTVYDPRNGYTIVNSENADGSYAVSTSQYGRLVSVIQYDASGVQIAQTTYGYDPQGRQNTVTDARNGTTTSFFNAADQVVATLTPSPDGIQSGQMTTNLLDSLGRVIQAIFPDGTSVTNVYFTNGLLQETYGSRTYPVAYTYDYAGRMKTMTTWTNFAGNSGAAVTTWNYDGYRGFLTNKAYANGIGPSYSYTSGGRLQSRVWARGVTTAYGYDNAGGLATVGYSDSTPGQTNGFDRLGRQIAVTNGATVCSWTYNDANEPLTESYTGGPLTGLSVTNGYDQFLRRTGLATLNSSSAVLASTAYGYDAASRLQTVSSGTNLAVYNYVANLSLVGQIGFYNNGALRMTTTKQYDYLNRLTTIQSSVGASPVASFNYAYNAANQRTQVTNTDSSYWVYQYDNLGQVTSGKKYWSSGAPVAGQQFTYNFDNIGNRESTASGGDATGANLRSANYSANNLNQYTSRDVPGYTTVLGSANPNATVTVNLQRAVRQGSYFWDELTVGNGSSSLYLSLTNLAVLNNGTNADIVATNVGNVFVPQTPETFGYDADGNITNSGRWTITWDAENRAVSFASLASAPTTSMKKVDCAYDWQGRRIQKIVSTNNGSAWIPVSTNLYVYDGWNLIAVVNPQSAIQQSFTWGTDLIGSQHGVGGLLLTTLFAGTNAGAYFYAYDANDNVAALINSANGTNGAHYEYDPFSGVIRASGALASGNSFLGSTKFYDSETRLYYYGFRYYDNSTGRWLNRDPQAENGGFNLYGFVGNDPVDGKDLLGQQTFTIVGKSFINGFGPGGGLGWRFGSPVTVPFPFNQISVQPWFANLRLAVFGQVVHQMGIDNPGRPFNQNPLDSSEDGQYRLYARRTIDVCFDGTHLNTAVTDSAQDGGAEFSLLNLDLISGTINSSERFENNTGQSVEFVMRAWGHPHPLAEVGMQWVATRSSVNIWHEARIKFSVVNRKVTYKVLSFQGSRYPSRKLWVDNGFYNGGKPDAFAAQDLISGLWNADPSNPTFVAQ